MYRSIEILTQSSLGDDSLRCLTCLAFSNFVFSTDREEVFHIFIQLGDLAESIKSYN